MIRNFNNYREGNFGIREYCILNDLSFFKVYLNFSADVLHDVFLGVFKIDLAKILNHLLDRGININVINNFVENFDWGLKSKESRPIKFTVDRIRNANLKMYGKECWTMVNFILYLINQFLCEDDPVYLFAINTVDILDLVLKSQISEVEIEELTTKIGTHNQQFLNLFGELTPKMHFLTHYGRLIRFCGPLRKMWCFSAERKHQTIKRYTKVCQSRKDIALSISKKLVLQEILMSMESKDIFKIVTFFSKTLNGVYNFLLPENRDFVETEIIEYKGTEYRINDFLLSNNRNFLYKVLEMYYNVEEHQVFLIVEGYGLQYTPNLRSYRVGDRLDIQECFLIDHFIYPPTDSHLFNNSYYVRIKHF